MMICDSGLLFWATLYIHTRARINSPGGQA